MVVKRNCCQQRSTTAVNIKWVQRVKQEGPMCVLAPFSYYTLIHSLRHKAQECEQSFVFTAPSLFASFWCGCFLFRRIHANLSSLQEGHAITTSGHIDVAHLFMGDGHCLRKLRRIIIVGWLKRFTTDLRNVLVIDAHRQTLLNPWHDTYTVPLLSPNVAIRFHICNTLDNPCKPSMAPQ
jgi:hypothetical protein